MVSDFQQFSLLNIHCHCLGSADSEKRRVKGTKIFREEVSPRNKLLLQYQHRDAA